MHYTNTMIEGQSNASMKRKKPKKAVNMEQKPIVKENEDEVEEEEKADDDEEEEEEEDNHDNNNTLVTVRIGRNIFDCLVCQKPLKILDYFL